MANPSTTYRHPEQPNLPETLVNNVNKVRRFLCLKAKILWNGVNPKYGLKTVAVSKKTGTIVEIKDGTWP